MDPTLADTFLGDVLGEAIVVAGGRGQRAGYQLAVMCSVFVSIVYRRAYRCLLGNKKPTGALSEARVTLVGIIAVENAFK